MLHDVRNAAVFPFLAGVLVLLTCDPDQVGVNLTGFLKPPSHQAPSATAPASQTPGASQSGVPVRPTLTPPARPTLSVVVLDPAHGGTDPGARGGAGLHESDVVVALASNLRAALEKEGFQVIFTRQGNDNPSFDDRSTLANAQSGAIFVSLHAGSTGLPGTVRVYTCPDAPGNLAAPGGLLPWNRAQAAFLTLSRKLADIAQGELAKQFKGSPNSAPTAAIRQLRSIAAPAIAVELSSVSVDDRSELDRMLPGVADAVARAIASFKPVYDSWPPGGGG